MRVISDNGISKVWYEDGYVYKKQPKFLTDNEIWCLKAMPLYVPKSQQVDIDTIKLEYIENQVVTIPDLLQYHTEKILNTLYSAGIRHGDLTNKNILIHDNTPYLIDFAESRLITDPRPDKRPEGDEYWIMKTIGELCAKHKSS